MNNENPISPEALKHNTGGRANGTAYPIIAPPSGSDPRRAGGLSVGLSEILSQPPSWLVRWGITVFFGVLVLLLAVSWWVRYPELIKGNLRIVADNAPKSVVTRSEGRLVGLFVKDGQWVKRGQALAQLETTAQPHEVTTLATLTDSLVKLTLNGDLSQAYAVAVPPFFQLGELQKSYQTFQEAFVKTKAFVGNGTAYKKRKILEDDARQLEELQVHLQRQLRDQKSDLSLVKTDLDMNEDLAKDKYVSRVEYRQSLSRYLNKKQAVEQSESQLQNNELAKNQKQQELLELSRTTSEQQNALLQTLRALKSEIEGWKQRYQAFAPTAGRVSFVQAIQENQTLKTGQELFYIMSNNAGFGGEMSIGQYNFGKIKIGQEVIVKLNGYPFEQFGTIRGQLAFISDVPRDSTYWAKVVFPKGLKTSTNRSLVFRNGLTATAEIITEDRSLFEQFFQELMRVFRR
ncbi:MAG: HlyD family efflux transporter periplasmic adaptor subunit [Cytophagia bacterium]|nr:MAG: HlyD family efflux transporter periplasmic adaptor subunit [Runella sp.]TAG21681.1 MAG: HlyD family efflux transporter periplasmic adaptor subunit [Cytophagales bacterium]TAG41073.1 MAG: HlyD family efflux transporter periplasmic adaptor subunit [Cytophagia bacterium]TAG83866.1 MAG: HlyD family efflux transporter periplasmic adaptor subunit [Cytophagales bacterium]